MKYVCSLEACCRLIPGCSNSEPANGILDTDQYLNGNTKKEKRRADCTYVFIIAVLELSLLFRTGRAHATEGHLDPSYSYSSSWVYLSLNFLIRVHVEGLAPAKVTSDPVK